MPFTVNEETALTMKDKQKVTRYAAIPAFLTPFVAMIQFGFSVGTINSISNVLKAHFLQNDSSLQQQNITSSRAVYFDTTLLPLLASCLPLGAIVGSLIANSLMAVTGKRNTLLYSQGLVIISSILSSLSKLQVNLITLYTGQLIVGFYSGIVNAIGPMYVTEIVPKQSRGIFGGLFSVFISMGVLFGNILGLKDVFGNSDRWHYQFLFASIPAIIYIFCGFMLPYSPRSAFLIEKDHEKTRKILEHLRQGNVDQEIDELQEEADNLSHIKPMSIMDLLCSRQVRWQLITTLVIFSTTQLSGFNALQYYLNEVFKQSRISASIVPYISIGVLILQTLYSTLASIYSDKVGRRMLLLIGNSMMLSSWILFTICLRYKHLHWVPYLTIVAALGVILGFCTGPGIVTFSIMPELFDQAARGAAMTLGVSVFWISLIIVAYMTPIFQKELGYLAFILYLIVSFITIVYVYFIVPETRGKNFIEISQEFAKLNQRKFCTIRS